MKEFGLIQYIQSRFSVLEGVRVGIGDDCAILQPGRFDLVTVDTMVEGVHFDLDLSSPYDVGWKLLACNLSDVAAMGGAPGPYFLSMSLNERFDDTMFRGFLNGLEEAAQALVPEGFATGLAGGDTTSTRGPLTFSITILGESAPLGAIRRAGANPGDRVVLIGSVGHAQAGLSFLQRGAELPEVWTPEMVEPFVRAHRRPDACVLAGALIGLHGLANAMIDVSDGLIQDLQHILRASNVGARIDAARIPLHPHLISLAQALGASLWEWLLAGGDDYALIAVVRPDQVALLQAKASMYGFDAWDIGEIRRVDEGLTVLDASGDEITLARWGYEHVVSEGSSS